MLDEEVEQGGVEDGRRVELLARDRCADNGEDAGADDCANAEGRKRPRPQGLFQPMFGLF